MSEETAASGPPKKRRSGRGRRVVKTLILGAFGLALCVALLAVALRLFYNDERLRKILEETLSERTKTVVTVGSLELDLLSGFLVKNITIGPPKGFSHQPLAVDALEVRYVPSALLDGRAEISEVRIERVSLVVEEPSTGRRNFDAIMQSMFPRPQKSDPVSAPSSAPADEGKNALPSLPELPIDLLVDRLEIGPVDIAYESPETRARLNAIYLRAEAGVVDGDYRALFRAGLGGPDDARSQLELHSGSRLALTGEQQLSAELRLANLDTLTFSLRFDGRTDPNSPIDAPPIDSALELDVRANLMEQHATVEHCLFSIGKNTQLTSSAVASELIGAPTVELGRTQVRIDLDELEPLARAVDASLMLGGSIALTAAPMGVSRLPPESASIELKTNGLRAGNGLHRIDDVNSTLNVEIDGDLARVDAKITAKQAASGANKAEAIDFQASGTAALAVWLGAGQSGAQALRFNANQSVGHIQTPGQSIRNVRLRAEGVLGDSKGERLDAKLTVNAGSITSQLGEEAVRIPSVAAGVAVSRLGQSIRVEKLRVAAGSIFDLQGEIAASRIFSETPQVESSSLRLAPFDLKQAVALLPKSLRPNQRFGGTIGFDAELSGRLPLRTLARAAQPPSDLESLGPFLERLATLFERGLPFRGHVGLETNDVHYEDLTTFMHGVSVDLDLNVLESGPQLDLALLTETVEQPASLGGLALNTSLAFNGRAIESDAFIQIDRLEGPSLPKPLRDATLEWNAAYTVGGAFAVEKLEARAPDRDGRLSASLLLQSPLRVVRERTWERSGMPDIDLNAALNGHLRIDESAPLNVPGVELRGAFGFDTALTVRDGLILTEGVVRTETLSIENEAIVVSEVDGGLPFEVSIATLPQDGYVELPQRVLFGDGRIRLRVDGSTHRANRRPLYFPRIRRYRADRGIRIRSVYARGFEVEHVELSGALRNGRVQAERARLSLLGGDIEGSMAVGLGADRSVSGSMAVKLSNLDASYFPALDLEPGEDSEIDADASLGFVVSSDRRDLTAEINVTKISAEGFDRLLQLVDPAEENQAIQSTRFYLNLAQINGVAMWLAYENLNMDLDANSVIKVPFTDIGVPNFERELLRRLPMSDFLDLYWDPMAQRSFGPLIGDLRAH